MIVGLRQEQLYHGRSIEREWWSTICLREMRGINMAISEKKYHTYLNILKEELQPAMGCTEPIAIAYAAARARDLLGVLPERAIICVSNNIIKNVKSVVVPNTDGRRGIEAAVVAGIAGGDASKKLEVIASITEEQKAKIQELSETLPIEVRQLDGGMVFDIFLTLYAGEQSVKVRVSQYHTNIVYEEKNGEVLFHSSLYDQMQNGFTETSGEEGLSDRGCLNLKEILEFADEVDVLDVKELLDRQIRYNEAIAEEGLLGDYGANIGSTIWKYYEHNVENRAKAKAAAGSDARMSGCELPVVINSGSGNQGIAVSVPVIEYAIELGVKKETLYRALTLANLIAIHEKTGIGRLSAYCGAVSAGCAAGCGIAYLYGGDYEILAHTLVNSLAIVSGIICDGAKSSCAAKIASSVEAGILGYHMYKNGQEFKKGEGIVNVDVETTIHNIGRLGKDGMRDTDREIVKIMLDVK